MPSTEDLRERLVKKLNELFRLDQPDLDFGFFKIMHAKAQQVSKFIENDLLKIVDDAFGEVDEARLAAAKAQYEKAVATAKEYGAIDPDKAPAVKEAKASYEELRSSISSEAQIYDHLYRFFERYYDNGDFISRRYYTRETSGKSAPYAIPYNGEEVMLHWANADQYYIKTADYYTNFTFDLRRAKEVRVAEGDLLGTPDNSLKVHFRIADATEGEHGNIKEDDKQKRFFIIYKDNPVLFNELDELIVNFEYRPDPEKTGQDSVWQKKRNAEAAEVIFSALKNLKGANSREYLGLLKIPVPTDSDKNRSLLAKYINQYTARNSMDYFIHKDLGGFLRRELDFYIKNEIMRMDDIENAEAPAVDTYLAKLKVLRKIAGKLIDFLAQLEDFQKKLWLKKKFVVETNYCITLDRVPEELYPEIVANEAQRQEWVKLFAIDEIQGDLTSPGYSKPLTVDFLKANDKLVLDTRFFCRNFKQRLFSFIEDFDEQCEGLLIHSDNFQALNLVLERFREQVKCIYIDPPYNAAATEILYKNGYKSSSWCALMYDRILLSKQFCRKDAISCFTIDDYELYNLKKITDEIFSPENFLANVLIRNNPSGRSTVTGFALCHEYALFYANSHKSCVVGHLPHSDEQKKRYDNEDIHGRLFEWENFRKSSAGSYRKDRPKQFFPIYYNKTNSCLRVPQCTWIDSTKEWRIDEPSKNNETVIYPIDFQGRERVWNYGIERTMASIEEMKVEFKDGKYEVYKKKYLQQLGVLPRTWWDKPEYSARDSGTRLLSNLFPGQKAFDFPKAVAAVQDAIIVSNLSPTDICLDYFAGSGTTAHAVIDLNREDDGNRKYILVEMGDYFDTVLKPRICKVVYSDSWKDGKPTARHSGVSQCFKYIRLESYEDTLNNLRFKDNPERDAFIASNDSLKEDYMLHYMLDVETKGSQSLLNIDSFVDPRAYTLRVKKPGSDEYIDRNVDMLETFNYLIGLRVERIAAPQTYAADFKRVTDPEVPADQHTKLVLNGDLWIVDKDADHWWFRKVEGWVPRDLANPDGSRENVLVIWRTLTGDFEKDNLMLDAWFKLNKASSDFAFDTVYVNGSNNLQCLATQADNWKVHLLEAEFMKRMWDSEGV